MVTFNCSRRHRIQATPSARQPVETLAALSGDAAPLDSAIRCNATHRANRYVEIRTEPSGAIARVRIGRWRVIVANEQRRLAEVRELGCGRVAIRIERFADSSPQPSSEIWQLYDLDGRLEAALQTTPDGKFALLTNYRTRQACRMVANDVGDLRAVETWKI